MKDITPTLEMAIQMELKLKYIEGVEEGKRLERKRIRAILEKAGDVSHVNLFTDSR